MGSRHRLQATATTAGFPLATQVAGPRNEASRLAPVVVGVTEVCTTENGGSHPDDARG
jgi:hypothetical protein